MARIDDALLAAEKAAGAFRDLMADAAGLFGELHAQGWDTTLPPALLRGPVLDIEPETPGQALADRQAAVGARLGAGLAAYEALLTYVNDPTHHILADIIRMAR